MTAILGLGFATPELTANQQVATEHALARCATTTAQQAFVRRVYARSAIDRRAAVILRDGLFPEPKTTADRGPGTARRLEEFQREAPELAHKACASALGHSAVAPGKITHLVTASCTGFAAPGVDIAIMQRLGLPNDVQRTNVGFMGCHAAINALRVAQGLLAHNADARVLLCCVELCSLHFQYGWRSDQVIANALFADGAAACVLSGAKNDAYRVRATGSCVVPGSTGAMAWRIGDFGFEMGLSPETPALIEQSLPNWLDGWLSAHDVTQSDVGHWAVHPGGPKVLDSVENALSLERTALRHSRAVLADHGNMSSATLLFILQRILDEGATKPIVALAFGPGLTIEAALIDPPSFARV